MPIYVQRCTACDHLFEQFRPMADFRAYPPCETCGGATELAHLPSGVSVNSDPVVVYRAPDGSFRYPGDPNGLSAKTYDTQGYTRVELRGWAEVRRFERTVNTREASDIARRVERQLEAREAAIKARRSEVVNGMRNGFVVPAYDDRGNQIGTKVVQLSPYGRDVMTAAMARNDGKPPPRAHDPGFHVEAYSYARGNRDAARDAQGRRRRD